MTTLIPHFIDGQRVEGTGEPTQDVFTPATGEVSAQVSLGGAERVAQAVESACTVRTPSRSDSGRACSATSAPG